MATTEAAAELETLLQRHGEGLITELAQLAEMPQVRLTEKSVYDRASPPGSKAQLRGVQFNLRCCTRSPVVKKCNDLVGEKACTTVVEAARFLRALVNRDHSSDSCLVLARQKQAEEGGTSSDLEPQNAFAVMLGARLAQQRAQSALSQAEQQAEQLRTQAHEVQRRLEEVSRTPLHPHKSRDSAIIFAISLAPQAEAALTEARSAKEQLEGKRQKTRAQEQEEWRSRPYAKYSTVEHWRQEEGRIYNRRRQELSRDAPARPAKKKPRGERDGPFNHWRHGLVGAVQYWANGSKAEAAELIFSLIEQFELQVASLRLRSAYFSVPCLPLALLRSAYFSVPFLPLALLPCSPA